MELLIIIIANLNFAIMKDFAWGALKLKEKMLCFKKMLIRYQRLKRKMGLKRIVKIKIFLF